MDMTVVAKIYHLNDSIKRAKIGLSDKTKALKKLHSLSVKLEKSFVPNNNFDQNIVREKAQSHLYGGRTVKGIVGPKKIGQQNTTAHQMDLF